MTDSEKLDILLEKADATEKEIASIKVGMQEMESGLRTEMQDMESGLRTEMQEMHDKLQQQIGQTYDELKLMDEMILDEVERVHSILDKHMADGAVHTAKLVKI